MAAAAVATAVPATQPVEQKTAPSTANRPSRSADSGVSTDPDDGLAVVAAPAAATAPASGTNPVAPVLAATSAITGSSTVTTTSGDSTTTVVTRQVFPEVTKLATAPGSHRITIVLNPEHLGEVRVSMVVRDGSVRVTLDAGDQRVQQALSSNTPELQRLLERTGATDTRISVQGQAPSQSAGQSPGQSAGQSLGQSSAFSGQAGQSSQSSQSGQPGHEQRHLPDVPPETDDRASPAGTPRRTAAGRLDQTL